MLSLQSSVFSSSRCRGRVIVASSRLVVGLRHGKARDLRAVLAVPARQDRNLTFYNLQPQLIGQNVDGARRRCNDLVRHGACWALEGCSSDVCLRRVTDRDAKGARAGARDGGLLMDGSRRSGAGNAVRLEFEVDRSWECVLHIRKRAAGLLPLAGGLHPVRSCRWATRSGRFGASWMWWRSRTGAKSARRG